MSDEALQLGNTEIVEPCFEVEALEQNDRGDVDFAPGATVGEIKGCSLRAVRGLDEQIIAEMNILVPDALIDFANAGVVIQGTSTWPLLQKTAKAALEAAIHDRGQVLRVNSAYRTIAQQFLLSRFAKAKQCGITIAALPGRSNHQSGLALDINDQAGWAPHLKKHGWKWFGPRDLPHFDFQGAGTRDIRDTAIVAFQMLWNRKNPQHKIKEDGHYGENTALALQRSPAAGF